MGLSAPSLSPDRGKRKLLRVCSSYILTFSNTCTGRASRFATCLSTLKNPISHLDSFTSQQPRKRQTLRWFQVSRKSCNLPQVPQLLPTAGAPRRPAPEAEQVEGGQSPLHPELSKPVSGLSAGFRRVIAGLKQSSSRVILAQLTFPIPF